MSLELDVENGRDYLEIFGRYGKKSDFCHDMELHPTWVYTLAKQLTRQGKADSFKPIQDLDWALTWKNYKIRVL